MIIQLDPPLQLFRVWSLMFVSLLVARAREESGVAIRRHAVVNSYRIAIHSQKNVSENKMTIEMAHLSVSIQEA